MERTRKSTKGTNTIPNVLSGKQLQALASVLLARAQFASKIGQQFGGDRDLYQALGYKTNLDYKDYFSQYTRQDMAKAIIDRPVKATWQGPLLLVESNIAEDTGFEKAWGDLNRKLGLKTRFSRVDKLTGLGRYGILVLGLSDVKKKEDFSLPVKEGGTKKLLYVKPFGEESAKIDKYVTDPKDDRFGMPLTYNIEVAESEGGRSSTINVHYSRVLHIVEDPLESEVFGTPKLEAVFNRLMDLEKLVGGDAEMFWRGARPGYQGVVDKDYTMTTATKTDLQDQVDEYEHNLRRILINEGVDLKELAQQIADPTGHVDVQIQMISAVTGIPKRILTGSERGELASTQDTSEWKEYVQGRREDHAEPHIVRPFVDRLIALGILPKPTMDYSVKWIDLYSQSEKARVEVGKARAAAIREYAAYGPASIEVFPLRAFYQFGLGLTDDEITLVEKMKDEAIGEEDIFFRMEQATRQSEKPAEEEKE